jgi:pyridoxamine 5'-phosphate oxidase
MVLLKEADLGGFIFYTNSVSQKGKDMLGNPRASMLFYWPSLGRQLRVEGSVERLTEEKSQEYFASRSRGSQLAAAASTQSAPMQARGQLEAAWGALQIAHPQGAPVPRPPSWGGWRLKPPRIEMWSDGEHRLHTRHSYALQPDGSWVHTLQQP